MPKSTNPMIPKGMPTKRLDVEAERAASAKAAREAGVGKGRNPLIPAGVRTKEVKPAPGSKERRSKYVGDAMKKAHADYNRKYRSMEGEEENPFNSQKG